MNEQEFHALYSQVFESPAGQLVLEHLKATCFFYWPSTHQVGINQPHGNPYITEFNEGKRSVLLAILTFLKPVEAKETK